VNPGLVACLIASILVGAAAAGLMLTAGWGWLAALAGYSFSGSVALVAATLAARPGERPVPVPVPARPALRKLPALALTARIG
jgi:hypothetical protein